MVSILFSEKYFIEETLLAPTNEKWILKSSYEKKKKSNTDGKQNKANNSQTLSFDPTSYQSSLNAPKYS